MIDLTKKNLERIFHGWQKRLGLSHWEVNFNYEQPAASHSYATIGKSISYDEAHVIFDPEWRTWDVKKTNYLAAHELLHLEYRDLEEAADSVEDLLTPEAYKMFKSRFKHELEGCIDRSARRLVAVYEPIGS